MGIMDTKLSEIEKILGDKNSEKYRRIRKITDQVIKKLSTIPAKDLQEHFFDLHDRIAKVNDRIGKISYSYNVEEAKKMPYMVIEDTIGIEKLLQLINDTTISNMYYRGVNDVSYELVSSFDREEGRYYNNLDSYFKKYALINLKIYNMRETNYQRCAFLQHYIQKSPLIDFTKNPKIALYFALYDSSLGEIHEPSKDIAIYEAVADDLSVIKNEDEANEILRKQYRVNIINSSDKNQEIVDVKEKPTIKIFDIEINNDRQKLQEGVFLFLCSGYIIDGKIYNAYFPNEIRIIKHIIPKKVIADNYKKIREELMEYLYIEDVERYIKFHMKKMR